MEEFLAKIHRIWYNGWISLDYVGLLFRWVPPSFLRDLLQEWRLISVAFVECRNSSDSCHQNVQRCQVTPLHSMLKVHLAHATMLTVTHRCGLIARFWTWKTPTAAAANIVISIINLSKTKGEECRLWTYPYLFVRTPWSGPVWQEKAYYTTIAVYSHAISLGFCWSLFHSVVGHWHTEDHSSHCLLCLQATAGDPFLHPDPGLWRGSVCAGALGKPRRSPVAQVDKMLHGSKFI